MTVDHQPLVNAVMPREQLEVLQAKSVTVQNWCTGLLPTKPPSLGSDLTVENQGVRFPFDMGNTLHNQQENILLSLRGRSQRSACLKRFKRQEKRKS